MDWSSVTSGILSGLTTALTWVVVVFLYNSTRNFLLERQLRRSFEHAGFAVANGAWGIWWTNSTSITVTVWGAAFSYASGGGHTPLSFWGEKTPQRRLRLRWFGKPRWVYRDFPSFEAKPKDGAVNLEFDMSGVWGIRDETIASWNSAPDGAYCLLEYSTLLNTRKRLVVPIKSFDELREGFERHLKMIKKK